MKTVITRELKTARGHMMPPPLHVCNELASLRKQRAVWFDVDPKFLLYHAPCLWYNVAQKMPTSTRDRHRDNRT